MNNPKPALSRSEAMFEDMIAGMDDKKALNFFIEFLKMGETLLSEKGQNYLLKRIGELTDKTINEADAANIVAEIVDELGPGYHPDNSVWDYVTRDDKPFFTGVRGAILEVQHDSARRFLGDKIYKVAQDRMDEE